MEKLKSEGAYNCNSCWWFCSGLKSQPGQVSPWLTEAKPRTLLFRKNKGKKALSWPEMGIQG